MWRSIESSSTTSIRHLPTRHKGQAFILVNFRSGIRRAGDDTRDIQRPCSLGSRASAFSFSFFLLFFLSWSGWLVIERAILTLERAGMGPRPVEACAECFTSLDEPTIRILRSLRGFQLCRSSVAILSRLCSVPQPRFTPWNREEILTRLFRSYIFLQWNLDANRFSCSFKISFQV